MRTPNAPTRTWIFICRLEKRGHRIFWQPEAQRFAIADNSGTSPDDTDDGVLWLDLKRQETFVLSQRSNVSTVTLVDDDGTESRTGLGWDGAVKFAELFDVLIEVRTDSGALVAQRLPSGYVLGRELPVMKLVREALAGTNEDALWRAALKTVSP